MCIEAGGAALGTSAFSPSRRSAVTPHGATATRAADVKSTRKRDVSDVRGAYAESVGLELGLADAAPGGPKTLLLVLIAAILALLGTLELLGRERLGPPVFPARGLGRSGKPLLFVDAKESAGESTRALAGRYEIVWVPDRDDPANGQLRFLPGLDEDSWVLRLVRDATFVSPAWKLKRIAQASQGLPAALVGDISSLHEAWARDRSAPTLLVNTDPEAGLSKDQVTRLLEWADALGPANGGRLVRTRRTMRALTRR